jgi:hypothetical protein
VAGIESDDTKAVSNAEGGLKIARKKWLLEMGCKILLLNDYQKVINFF